MSNLKTRKKKKPTHPEMKGIRSLSHQSKGGKDGNDSSLHNCGAFNCTDFDVADESILTSEHLSVITLITSFYSLYFFAISVKQVFL